MIDIYGSHFEYGGKSSRRYDLIIASVNAGRMNRSCVSGEGVTKYNKAANKFVFVDEDKSSAQLSFDIEIVTANDRCLTRTECREVEKWLFCHHGYRKLYFDTADDTEGTMYEYIDGVMYRNYINCRLVNPEKLEYNGGVVGYKATLEADSNMFWQDAITKKYIINNGHEDVSSSVVINVDTDDTGYIYPKVRIVIGHSGGDISIVNHTDNSARITEFVSILQNASIVMNGELNSISGGYYDKFSNRHFIRLLSGENRLTVKGDVSTIEFEYCARRMM